MENSHNSHNNIPLMQKELLTYRRICSRALKREKRTLQKREEEVHNASHYEKFRQIGDSLLSGSPENLLSPHAHADSLELLNVHTGIKETVRLNPKLTVSQNAQLYYKKARKGERGLQQASEKENETRQKYDLLQSILEQCTALLQKDIVEESDIIPIRNALSAQGIIPSPGSARSSAASQPHPLYRRFTIEGFPVYISKNNTQNDELSLRFAKPWDIWLHVAAHAGSHVVIKRDKNADFPPKTVIEKAGALAVWFSKARHTSFAEVHVTQARYVHKRRKAPPGEVIAERCKTVRVAPVDPREMFRKTAES